MFDTESAFLCKRHWDLVGKPLGSLGVLEDLVAQLGGIAHTQNVRIDRRAVLVVCADNGVVQEKVTQTDSSITALNAKSIAGGTASVNAFARVAHADVFAVDVGINQDQNCEPLIRRKAAWGTRNIAQGPAITQEEMHLTMQTGMDLVKELKEKSYQIICTGEMGIGNTTTSSAMAAVMLNTKVEEMTGRGAGLSDEGLLRKVSVIKKAIAVNRPDPTDAGDVLMKLGGLDIAALTGVFLGGQMYSMPIVIDGFISAIAALVAMRIDPGTRDYMLASHMGREPGCRLILNALGKHACITADMALGEGTGAVALLPLLDMALGVYHQSKTFDSLNMPAYQRFG